MSRYELKESFHIDDGQLDGLSTQECFVLGYEYSQICHKMNIFARVTGQTVHRSNVDRLNKAAEARGHSPLKITEIPDEFYCQISWDIKD